MTMNKRPINAVVQLSADETTGHIYMSVKSPDGRGFAGTNLHFLGSDGYSPDSVWLKWARDRMQLGEATDGGHHAYLVPTTPEQADMKLPPLTEEEIHRTWKALTNGIGEQPYAKEHKYDYPGEDDVMIEDSCGFSVYVADHQELAMISSVHDPEGYDQEIAAAICNAGRAIKQLTNERDLARGQAYDFEMRLNAMREQRDALQGRIANALL